MTEWNIHPSTQQEHTAATSLLRNGFIARAVLHSLQECYSVTGMHRGIWARHARADRRHLGLIL